MAPIKVIWMFLVKIRPLPATLWLPSHPLPSYSIGVLMVLATPVKKLFKMAGNPAIAIQCTVDTVNYFNQL